MLLGALNQRKPLSEVAAGGVSTAILHLIGAQLCERFRYSRRYVYKLFALQNLSPADYIQRERLEACKQLLANPHY